MEVFDAFERGDMVAARRAQAISRDMISTAAKYGGLPAFKAMMSWAGVDCGPCRPPLKALDNGEREHLREELEKIGLSKQSFGA